jgi:uncharacterized protein (TIGR00730 family)
MQKQIIKNTSLTEDQFNELSEIHYEYEQAMLLNSSQNKKVTIYGGAKLDHDSETYEQIQRLGKEFGLRGWSVVTGGGPGAMSAGLLGVKEGKGQGIGYRLRLKNEPPLVHGDIDFLFEHFPPRKYALRQSDAYIYCPGSVGTLDELMENLDLMKTQKLPIRPIYLYNSKFWTGLINWLEDVVVDRWQLGEESLKTYYKIVDFPDQIITDLFG